MHDPEFDQWFCGLTEAERPILKAIEDGIERYGKEHRERTGMILELLQLKHLSHIPPTSLRIEQIEGQLRWIESWRQWSRAAKTALTKILNNHGGKYELFHGPKWNYPLPSALIRLSDHLETVFMSLPDQKESFEKMMGVFKKRLKES